MKYMLIMRDTQEAVDASQEVDFEEIINAMGAYNESLIKAGVFATAEGLAPATEGFVVDFAGEKPVVTDGPYGETHELFNGRTGTTRGGPPALEDIYLSLVQGTAA